MNEIIVTGRIEREGWHDILNRVYSPQGVAPTLNCCQGGGLIVKILVSEVMQ